RNRVSARSIVPSPPSTTAMSGAASSASPRSSSTPLDAATARRRARASLTVPSRPCVTTAAMLTDGIGDPAVEVGWDGRRLSGDGVEDDFRVPLRSGRAGVSAPARLGPGLGECARDLAPPPALHLGVTDDALRRVATTRLELRLDEDESLPAGRGQPQRG